MVIETIGVPRIGVGCEQPGRSVASLLFSRPRSTHAASLSKVRPGTDANAHRETSLYLNQNRRLQCCLFETGYIHHDVPVLGQREGSVGGFDSAEWNEIDRNGEPGGLIRIDQSLLYFRSGCELAGRDQAFFQEFKLRPAFDSDSKLDVAGRGPRHEVFAIG